MILRVQIDAGCISCNLCEDLVPEVFQVPAGEACTPREGHAAFLAEGGEEAQLRAEEAVEACPVEVILPVRRSC